MHKLANVIIKHIIYKSKRPNVTEKNVKITKNTTEALGVLKDSIYVFNHDSEFDLDKVFEKNAFKKKKKNLPTFISFDILPTYSYNKMKYLWMFKKMLALTLSKCWGGKT